MTTNTSDLLRPLAILICFHIAVIAASNYLVQIPVTILGLHTTWGTFTFPLVYLATDLTVRIFGAASARKIIFWVMFPALLLSYVVSIIFFQGSYQGISELSVFNSFVFRIALASFIAYAAGQFLDIRVFDYLRKNSRWWVAPAASTIVGNLVDTALFYFIAFYRSTDEFMATYWPEIGLLDYGFKIVVSLLLFLPVYGVLLQLLSYRISGKKSHS